MESDAGMKRDEALSFLVNHDAGVLATVSRDGQPGARMVYYTADDSFNLYFMTLKNTRKVADLAANVRAAFVVSDMDTPQTIQIEGNVADLTDTATLDPLLSDFVKRLSSHQSYNIPLTHLDASEIRFYKFTPTWIRWGDFTFGQGTDTVLTKIEA